MKLSEIEAARRTVTTPYGDVSYIDVGEGPVAVFVHGVFLNGALWRNVVGELRDGFRCVAVDLLGHGATKVAPGRGVSLPEQAEMLEAFCVALGIEEVHLVGNDTGGAVCQIFAARHPGRLRTLTLTNCDTQGNLPPALFAPVVEIAAKGELGPVLRAMRDDLGFARSQNGLGIGYERPKELDEEVIRCYLDPLVASPEASAAVEAYITGLDDADLVAVAPLLAELVVPTLIVWGTGDPYFDVAQAYWLRDAIPGALEVVELAGAKLFFPEERFVEFADLLRGHWCSGGR